MDLIESMSMQMEVDFLEEKSSVSVPFSFNHHCPDHKKSLP